MVVNLTIIINSIMIIISGIVMINTAASICVELSDNLPSY